MNRRYVLIGGIGLISAATVGIVWVANYGGSLFSRPQPAPDFQRLLAALEEPTRVDAQETPLRDVLAELAKQHNVDLRCDEDALKSAGLSVDAPVTLHVEDVRLRSALNLLCRLIDPGDLPFVRRGRFIDPGDLTVVLHENEIVVTTRNSASSQGPLIGRVYPITPLMFGDGPVHEDLLVQVITSTVRPLSWTDGGGPGVIEVLPGGLAVANSLEVHQQIEQLLKCLEQVSVDETSTAPIDVGAWPSSRHAAILRALDQETILEFLGTPLADVCDYLSELHEIPIVLDHRALEDIGLDGDTLVVEQLSGIRLKAALNLLLHQLDLTFVVREDVLMITTPEEAETMLTIRLYPVRDLIGVPMPDGADYDSLIELVNSMISPTSWPHAGGDDWPDAGADGNIDGLAGCLVVAQTRQIHREVESLLARIRRRLDPYETSPSEDAVSPRVQRIEAALAELTEIKAREIPLQDVVDYLRMRHEIEIVIDHRALADVGLSSEVPLTDEIVGLTLEQALNRLLRPKNLTFVVRDDVLLVTTVVGRGGFFATTREVAERRLECRLFDVRNLVDPDFGLTDEGLLIELITYSVSPTTWVDAGGSGAIESFHGLLVVSQTRDVLRDVQTLLDGLTQLQNNPDSLAPIAVASPPDTGHDAICEKLESTVDLSFHRIPLDLVVKRLSRDHGLPISIDRRAFFDTGVVCDRPVTRTVRNMSLGAALVWILHQTDLAYVVRDGSVWITTSEEAESALATRIYPVRDLVYYPSQPPSPPDGQQQFACWKGGSDYDSLIQTINECIEPDSWVDAGGPGSIDWYGEPLVASQTPRVLAEIEGLLAKIRYNMSPSAAPVPDTPAIEEALAASVSIQSAGMPLRVLLDQLAQRYHVTVILDAPAYEPIRLQGFFVNPPANRPIHLAMLSPDFPDVDNPFGGGDDPFGDTDDPFGGGCGAPHDGGRSLLQPVVESTCRGIDFLRRQPTRGLELLPDVAEVTRQWFQANQERLRFEVSVALRPIHCDISNVPLEEALEQILGPLGLDFAIRDEALWITTAENAKTVLTTEVYDVRELVQIHRAPQPDRSAETLSYPDIGFYPYSVQTPDPRNIGSIVFPPWDWGSSNCSDLRDLILESVDPNSWADDGSARIYNDLLIVRQTRRGHAQVRKFLSSLRREAKHLPSPMDLTKRPTQQDLKSLVEYLKRAEDPQKLAYALYLIELTTPPAEAVVPALMDRLMKLDPIDDFPTHVAVLRALSSFGRDAEEALPLLVRQWRALPASHREPGMIDQIGRLGPAAVPLLCEVLKSQEEGCFSTACDCLGRMGPDAKEAVVPLLELLDSDEAHDRHIGAALAAIDPDGSLSRQAIARWASDPDRRVRQRAAKAEELVRSIFGDPH